MILRKILSRMYFELIIVFLIIISGCIGNQEFQIENQSLDSSKVIQNSSQFLITGSQSENGIKLIHQNGDSLNLSKIKIIISQGAAYTIYNSVSLNNDIFKAGDTLHITSNGINLNNRILVTGRKTTNMRGPPIGKISVTLMDNHMGKKIAFVEFDESVFFYSNNNT